MRLATGGHCAAHRAGPPQHRLHSRHHGPGQHCLPTASVRWRTPLTQYPPEPAELFCPAGRGVRQVRRLLRSIYRPHHWYYIHVDSQHEWLYQQLAPLQVRWRAGWSIVSCGYVGESPEHCGDREALSNLLGEQHPVVPAALGVQGDTETRLAIPLPRQHVRIRCRALAEMVSLVTLILQISR